VDADSSASKTALMVCAYRARTSRSSAPLFVDPWAEALAGAEGHDIARQVDASSPPMELWFAVRVAYLDRLVGLAVDRLSIRQIVILGAGYDTRAARLPRAGVEFYEVDHPATQAAKRARVAALPGYPVEAARYVACDLQRDDPVDRLASAGFDPRGPALVIWEGVVSYLPEPAIRATATRLATGLDPRSLLAFDFLGKTLAAGTSQAAGDREMAAQLGRLGEPLRFGSDDILPLLHACGYRWVRSLDFNELALELVGDYQRERMFRFQHLALAAVRPPVAGWP